MMRGVTASRAWMSKSEFSSSSLTRSYLGTAAHGASSSRSPPLSHAGPTDLTGLAEGAQAAASPQGPETVSENPERSFPIVAREKTPDCSVRSRSMGADGVISAEDSKGARRGPSC